MEFLNVLAADADGVIDLTKSTRIGVQRGNDACGVGRESTVRDEDWRR